MNGVHDLGGTHGHGPINPQPNEPVFHEPWEKRAFAMFFATFAGGFLNVDEFRYAIERMDPAEYLSSSYYEHWVHTYETLLTEKGVLTQAELDKKYAELAKEAA
jgi:nitrile hydratase